MRHRRQIRAISAVSRGRRRLRALAAAAERWQTVYAAIACGVVVLHPPEQISAANEAAQQILGCSLAHLQAQGLPPTLARPAGLGTHHPDRGWPVRAALHTRTPQHAVTVGITPPDGTRRWLQVDAVPVLGADGQPQQVILSFVDTTARQQAEEALAHQALHDALTGLPNRTLLHDRMQQAVLAAQRRGHPLALLLLDLDRFKEVNDTLGHPQGDALLQQVATRLRGVLRASDTVARLGGDEFAVLLPATDAAGATHVVRKILTALADPIALADQRLKVDASIGIALWPDHGTDSAALLRQADVAMYQAKRAGAGYILYDAAQDQYSPHRLLLMDELRQALDAQQLLLHYQPLVDLDHRGRTRVEALLRWPHPRHGFIPPDQFIPLAEQTGLIAPLTRWVLEEALRQCQAWQRAGRDLGVAVNLSTRTVHDPQLPDTIAWLLQRYQIAPAKLTLEITESALMADPAGARAVLTRLTERGVHMAIDDFGTGYSSLGYLKQLPVDEMKIDKSFVQAMGATSAKDTALVRSIIELGHNLGLRVVAEGVETRQVWERLRAARCDTAQGYYLSRPLATGDLERWLSMSPWSHEHIAG